MKNLFKKTLTFLLAFLLVIAPVTEVMANSNETNSIYENAANSSEEIIFSAQYPESSLKMSIMSDIHVLPEELIAENPAYTIAENSDRKLFTQSQGIFDSALWLAKNNDSEIIMIPGDITKDGEKPSHKYVSEHLEAWKKEREAEGKKANYFVIPGNHDINNYNGYDFTTYDDATGKIELAGLTNHQDIIDMYSSLYENAVLYKDSDEYKEYMSNYPNLLEGHGACSYAKHVDLDGSIENKNGLTVIGIDTSINTAEINPSGKDSHITEGTIGQSLYQWAKKQIIEAKNRNDVVFILSHHGYIPHFVKEPSLLKEYLLNEWDDDNAYDGKRPAEAFADLGVSYIFTGHMHSQDIAKYTSKNGNTIYDIETGSTVTYPCPVRHVKLTNSISNSGKYNLNIDTELIKKVQYTDPKDRGLKQIDDLTTFAKSNLINENLLVGASGILFTSELYKNLSNNLTLTITGLLEKDIPDPALRHQKLSDFLWAHLDDLIIPKIKEIANTNFAEANIEIKVEADKLIVTANLANLNVSVSKEDLCVFVENLLTQFEKKLQDKEALLGYVKNMAKPLLDANITDEITIEDFANYSYLCHLAGNETLSPEMQVAMDKIKNEGVIKDIIEQVKNPLSDVLNDVIKGINYDPLPSEIIDFSAMGIGGNIVKQVLTGMVGDSIEKTLMNLGFKKDGEHYKSELDTSKLIDKLLSMDAVTSKLADVDKLILDIADAFTSEDQDSYKDYSYKEDNRTSIAWQAISCNSNFIAVIKDNSLAIISGDNCDFSGKIIQENNEIPLDDDHSAKFEYNKPFYIKLSKDLGNGYTEFLVSNVVKILKEDENKPDDNTDNENEPHDNTDDENEPHDNTDNENKPKPSPDFELRPAEPKKEIIKEDEPVIIKTPVKNVINETKPITVNAPILPVNFSDLPKDNRAKAIKNLASRGILLGMGDNLFKPEVTVSRAMIAEILMRISSDKSINYELTATDIKPGDWYYNSVKWAMTHGIVTGYLDGTFKPNNKISRQELAVMLSRMLKELNINIPNVKTVSPETMNYLPDWSRDAVIDTINKGLLEFSQDGENKFDGEVTRADLAAAINTIINFVLK